MSAVRRCWPARCRAARLARRRHAEPLDTYRAVGAVARQAARAARDVQMLIAEPSALKALDGQKHRHRAGAGRHPVPQGRAMGRPAAEDRAGAAGRNVPALGQLRRRRQAGRGARHRLSGDRRYPRFRSPRRRRQCTPTSNLFVRVLNDRNGAGAGLADLRGKRAGRRRQRQ